MTVKVKPFTVNLGKSPSAIVTDAWVAMPGHIHPGNIDRLCVPAMWDTGCTHTSIAEDYASLLGLRPVGRTTHFAAAGETSCNIYDVDLWLPYGFGIEGVKVYGFTRSREDPVAILIGMDVIGCCDFALTHNRSGETIFSFEIPPIYRIDFERLANQKGFVRENIPH